MLPDLHQNYSKIILQRITPAIKRTPNNYRAPGCSGAQLEPGLMLALTLSYFSSHNMFTDLLRSFRLTPNTISEVVWAVCQAIVDGFWTIFIVTPNTEVQWFSIVEAFHKRWNFHYGLGDIDGKHVATQKPSNAGSDFLQPL